MAPPPVDPLSNSMKIDARPTRTYAGTVGWASAGGGAWSSRTSSSDCNASVDGQFEVALAARNEGGRALVIVRKGAVFDLVGAMGSAPISLPGAGKRAPRGSAA